MCTRRGLSKSQFIMDIVAIFTRIIRSIGFNSFIFVLGFVLGFGTLQVIIHMQRNGDSDYQCVSRLEAHLREQRVLDRKIDGEIRELKVIVGRTEDKSL